MSDRSNRSVFISYVNEDAKSAETLYNDLKNAGIDAQLDKTVVHPGENRRYAIYKAIKNSRFFIPLFSSLSVKEIGEVQQQFRYAIETSGNFPENEVYVIPTRLDNCEIPYEKLKELEYVDLFPRWENGLAQIFETFKAKGIEINKDKMDSQVKAISEQEQWQTGLSGKAWDGLLTSIYEKTCVPFIGEETFAVKVEDEKPLSFSRNIIEKWKHSYSLQDLYSLSRVDTLEDSHQLARLAQLLEIKKPDKKDMLKDILKEIHTIHFSSQFKNKSPYEILADLDLPLYITTNYDKSMESALSKNPKKQPQSEFCDWNDGLINYKKSLSIPSIIKKDYRPRPEEPLVYHILGDIDTPQSMVLTEKEYFDFVINFKVEDEKERIPSFIRRQLGLSSLLFIGYRLEDINFRTIFQGFLSFLNPLPEEFRGTSIAIQIPPRISSKEQIKMKEYLEHYTRNMFDVNVFWDNTYGFVNELDSRWGDFKKKRYEK